MTQHSDTQRGVAALAAALAPDGCAPLVVTGAGVSVASGIPTFRGSEPGAVWSEHVMEMGTNRFFERHPDRSWQMYLDRFDAVRSAQPNPAHQAIADLETRRPKTRLITQNVDGLHHDAGSQAVIEIHGSSRKMRCANRHCGLGPPRGAMDWDEALLAAFRAAPGKGTVPRCPKCGKRVRPHILWFDESYVGHEDYQFRQALTWAEAATVVIFIGTSFSVGITEHLLDIAANGGLASFVIDPYLTDPPVVPGLVHIAAAAETVLPKVVAGL